MMSIRLLLVLSAFMAAVTFCSCDSGYQSVTTAEAETMSKLIDSAIQVRKPKLFTSLFNMEEFGKRLKKSATHKISSDMEKGVRNAFEKASFGDQIIREVVDKSGSYQLVKRYEKDRVQHLLYRLYSEDGLNYHDFELVKRNGKVTIADIFIYTAAENFSALLAGILDTFDKPNSDIVGKEYETGDRINKIKDLMSREKYQEAKLLFDKLPASVQEQKTIALLGVLISSNLGDKIYLEQMNRFEARYPDEPNTYLLLLDAAILNKNYPKALENINHLDSLLNKDSFLDYYRALMYNLMEEPAKARKCLEELTHHHPEFEAGVLELIVNYLESPDDSLAVPLIRNFKKNPEFSQEKLGFVLAGYPEFEEE